MAMSALRGVCVEQMCVGRVASFQFTVFAMEHLPKRTSLVHATATTLKEWISTGMLSEVLPGELQLKGRLGVGRDTLRLALKLLTDEGWVEPAAKGQQRRVHAQRLSSPKQTDKDQLPVTFLSPHRIEHRVTLLEMEDTQMRLAEQGRKLRFLSPDIFHLKHPERQLERLVHAHPSAAWILYIDRKSTRLNSSHLVISYAVFCLKKKNYTTKPKNGGITFSCPWADPSVPPRDFIFFFLMIRRPPGSTLFPYTTLSR